MRPERDGVLDRLAGRRRASVPARVAEPGRDVDLVEQSDQHLGLADGRDGLEGQEVHAGLDERVDPRPVERRPARRDRGRSRRGIRTRRPASRHTGRPTRRRADRSTRDRRPRPRTGRGRAGRPSTLVRDRRERRGAVQTGGLEARDRRLVAGRRRHPRSGPEVVEMDGLDGVRIGHQQPRRPEPVGQVEAARLELGGEPAVEDDDLAGRRDQLIRAWSAGARLMNLPWPLRPGELAVADDDRAARQDDVAARPGPRGPRSTSSRRPCGGSRPRSCAAGPGRRSTRSASEPTAIAPLRGYIPNILAGAVEMISTQRSRRDPARRRRRRRGAGRPGPRRRAGRSGSCGSRPGRAPSGRGSRTGSGRSTTSWRSSLTRPVHRSSQSSFGRSGGEHTNLAPSNPLPRSSSDRNRYCGQVSAKAFVPRSRARRGPRPARRAPTGGRCRRARRPPRPGG